MLAITMLAIWILIFVGAHRADRRIAGAR